MIACVIFLHSNDDAFERPLTVFRGPEILPSRIITETEYPKFVTVPNIPQYRSLLQLIGDWDPNVPDYPARFTEVLQHFNYSNATELDVARAYRNAEIPFKLYDIPDVSYITKKWSDTYLTKELRKETVHVEKSDSNHFMYWNMGLAAKDFVSPTKVVRMSFPQWRAIARNADIQKTSNNSEHYYFMTGSTAKDSRVSFIPRDLPFFATTKNNFFITNVQSNKGTVLLFADLIITSHIY